MYVICIFLYSTLPASITNSLLNNETIAIYGYVIGILLIFYRFWIDIETPYIKLKNLIAKERAGLSWDRIMATRKAVVNLSIDNVFTDLSIKKEVIYPIPMTYVI
jgi:hypothetical protein